MAFTMRAFLAISIVSLTLLASAPAAAEIVGDFPEVVIFGQTNVTIDQNVTVHSGDVVANGLAGTLSLGNKVTLPAFVEPGSGIPGEAKADTISVGNFVNLNGVELCNVEIGDVDCAPLGMPPVYGQVPLFQEYTGTGSPVDVPKSGSTTLTPGDYGALTVGVEGTVTFEGPGEFNFTSFTAGRKGQFVFTGGPIEVRVSGDFSTGVEDNINLAESPVTASDLVFYVGGNATIGAKTNVNANFYVDGLLEIGSNVIAKGAYLADVVVVGQKSQFTLATFFDFQPVALDDAATTDEDVAVPIDVLANDSDPEGDPIFVNSVTQGVNGGVSFTADNVTYNPNPDYFGPDAFTYEVCDVDTQINEDNCTTATVMVTVNSINDPPVAGDDVATTNEDTAVSIPVATLLSNDTGGPANEVQTVTFESVAGSGNGHVEIVGANVEYTPTPDFNGADSFDYVICDGGQDDDTATDGDDLCDTGSVSVTVTPVNDDPVAGPQDVFTDGDVDLVIVLAGSDIDGDSLTFSIASGPDTAKGTLGLVTQDPPSSALVTYDPANAGNEENEFTFQVADGNGGTATAIVRINPGGDPECFVDSDCDSGFFCDTSSGVGVCEPVPPTGVNAKEDTVETDTGVAVDIILVAAAESGIGDLVFTIDSGPTSGSLTAPVAIDPISSPIRSAKTTYTPTCTPASPPTPPNCSASFVFEACDVATGVICDIATVTIFVADPDTTTPDPPVAEDMSVGTSAGTNVVFGLEASAGSSNPSGEDEGRDLFASSGFVGSSSTGSSNGLREGSRAASGGSVVGGDPMVAITPGAGWSSFSWSGTAASCTPGPSGLCPLAAPVFSSSGPFDFTGDGCVSVTDDFLKGDRFAVYDNGQLVAATPVVAVVDPSPAAGADDAYTDPTWSSGTFNLAGGGISHSITIRVELPSFQSGAAFVRVDSPSSPFCNPTGGEGGTPLLTYTITNVPSASFGVLKDSAGNTITENAVLFNPTVTFVPAPGVVTATGSFNFQVTNTQTNLTSLVATVDLTIGGFINFCLTNKEACDDGRGGGGSAPVRGGGATEGLASGTSITVSVVGPGDVSSSRPVVDGKSYRGLVCGGGACSANFPEGSTVALYARPTEARSEFVEWGGDCYGSDPVALVRAGKGMHCTATFRERQE